MPLVSVLPFSLTSVCPSASSSADAMAVTATSSAIATANWICLQAPSTARISPQSARESSKVDESGGWTELELVRGEFGRIKEISKSSWAYKVR